MLRNVLALVRRPAILAVRPRGYFLYWPFLRWLRRRDRALFARLDVRRIGSGIWRPERYRLLLHWTDPLTQATPARRAWLRALEERIPLAGNSVAALEGCRKSLQSRVLRDARLDAPPVGPPESFAFPLIVRSDVEHSQEVHRFDTPEELARFDLARVVEPVASPFVETRSPDGWYRKYRYLLCGARGVPRHLQMARSWFVRMRNRDLRPEALAEERAYTAGDDPCHGDLDRARRALGLEFVAFDYSLRPGGGMVLWEANPLPCLWLRVMDGPRYAYQRPAIERCWGLMRDDLRRRLDGACPGSDKSSS